MKFFILMILLPFMSLADVCVSSSSGNSLCFSDQMVGDNYNSGSWKTMYLLKEGKKIPIDIKGRYYSTASEYDVSPSGSYINITTIEGGYIDDGDSREYVDRAYCNVIDMRTGCIISDWDGSMCGYQWEKNKDVLSSPIEGNSDNFDFLSFKPNLSSVKKENNTIIRNLLRCEVVSNKNIDAYVKLSRVNSENKDISAVIIDFYRSIGDEYIVNNKAFLYSGASDDAITKAYLIAGDHVKLINESSDRKWKKIIYINAKKHAVVGWVKSGEIE